MCVCSELYTALIILFNFSQYFNTHLSEFALTLLHIHANQESFEMSTAEKFSKFPKVKFLWTAVMI